MIIPEPAIADAQDAPSRTSRSVGGYCLGKVAFVTAGSAYDALRVMVNRRQFRVERGATLHTYRCRTCQAWHIGNLQK